MLLYLFGLNGVVDRASVRESHPEFATQQTAATLNTGRPNPDRDLVTAHKQGDPDPDRPHLKIRSEDKST